jgi:branched-chain amino acid aminotransferase
MEIKKNLLPADKLQQKPKDENALGFGRIFADHLFAMNYEEGKGWINPRIDPYGPIQMDPAALVLHYGQEVFEGMKAYYGKDDGVYLFRPEANIKRMANSCARLCMPAPDKDLFLKGLMELIRTEKDWIPKAPGTSLYIRPNIIATEAALGVKVSDEYLFYIMVGPVGAYYPEGFAPTKIYVEEKYVRAAPGGLGEAKTAANYAASLYAGEKAHEEGYTQVLWLDACDKKTIEEVGTSNMFFVIDGEVITAPLDGTILPGITRDSVITLCKHWDIPVSERKITIDEVIKAQEDGKLDEAFGSGTAAVISPVGSFTYRGQEIPVGKGEAGEISRRLYDEITGIQWGERPDPFGWVTKVC